MLFCSNVRINAESRYSLTTPRVSLGGSTEVDIAFRQSLITQRVYVGTPGNSHVHTASDKHENMFYLCHSSQLTFVPRDNLAQSVSR